MIAPPDARQRILHTTVPEPRALAAQIASRDFLARAEVLKRDTRTTVLRATHPTHGALIIKTARLARAKDRLNALAARTQADRHVRATTRLERAGVPTAEVLLHVRGRDQATGDPRESLVLRAILGRTLLHHLDDLANRRAGAIDFPTQCAVARALGAQLQRFAAARIFNRDHKPSNLIVDLSEPEPHIAVIDAVDIKRDRLKIGALRMLKSLMLEPLGCACPPPRTMRMRTLIAATTDAAHPHGAPRGARKAVWRAIEESIREHGDPTPKVNPLR